MNFTEREKKFLTFLAFVLVAVVYLNLFLRPQLKSINALKGEIQEYTRTYSMNVTIKQKVEKMDSEIKILSQKLKDLRSVFPPVMNYDEILIIIRDMAKRADVDIASINFSEPVEIAAEAEKSGSEQAADGENTEITNSKLKEILGSFGLREGAAGDESGSEGKKAPISNGKGYVMSVALSAKGTNSQLKSFLYSAADLRNKAAFSDIRIASESKDTLVANMTINFYGIMDKSAVGYTLLGEDEWTPLEASGTDNMFKPYAGYTGSIASTGTLGENRNTTPEKTRVPEAGRYDFTMRVLPFGDGMAPPTVSMAGEKMALDSGTSRIRSIYGDNKGEEKAELYVEEKDGKFYCKFKTESEAFPDEGYSQTAEFKPEGGNIKMLIDSMPRKFKQDKSGVYVNIVNKTSKNVLVKVINEDKTEPRVKIEKTGGNIDVEYE